MKSLTRHCFLLATSTVLLPTSSGLAQTVTRGPYLNMGSTTGVTIRWRTDIATNTQVNHTGPGGVYTDLTLTTEHQVRLEGILPGKQIFYTIGTTDGPLAGNDADHFFYTAPETGSLAPTRVWVIGDSGLPGQNQRNVRDGYIDDYAGTRHTDVWLMLGDNAYSAGTDAEYQAGVFDAYRDILRNTILWPTRGNHDVLYAGNNNDYYEIFTLPDGAQCGGLASGSEAYYSFDRASVHFICLDSQGSDRTPAGPMLTWLANDLAATAQPWIIAFWHHPPYTKGSHDSDNSSDSGGRMGDMRANALPILEAGGVDLVLAGHSHCYERSFMIDGHYGVSSTLHDSMKVDAGNGYLFGDGPYHKPSGASPHAGAVYAVAGSSSRLGAETFSHPVMITSLVELGSMVIDVSGNQLNGTFIDSTGTVLDEFTIMKGVTTSVGERVPRADVRLAPAFPNPFSASTHLSYALPSPGAVALAIYDATGRKVATLVDGQRGAGEHTVAWDGRGQEGNHLANGVYFGVLEFAGERRARKLVLVR